MMMFMVLLKKNQWLWRQTSVRCAVLHHLGPSVWRVSGKIKNVNAEITASALMFSAIAAKKHVRFHSSLIVAGRISLLKFTQLFKTVCGPCEALCVCLCVCEGYHYDGMVNPTRTEMPLLEGNPERGNRRVWTWKDHRAVVSWHKTSVTKSSLLSISSAQVA